MKNYAVAVIVCTMVTFLSCKSNRKVEVKDGEISTTDAVQAAEAITQEASEAKGRWEARRAKGDTMALPYKELEAFLPGVDGYTKDGSPKGSQMNMPGMGSWSQTEQQYVNGDKRIKVTIIDYNASQMAFSGATALYKMGFSAEDDTRKQGSVDLGVKDAAAYETIYKQQQEAQLTVIAGDRFFISLESNGSNDIELLKSAAKNVLSGLSSKY
jgi:hypothetical protein